MKIEIDYEIDRDSAEDYLNSVSTYTLEEIRDFSDASIRSHARLAFILLIEESIAAELRE